MIILEVLIDYELVFSVREVFLGIRQTPINKHSFKVNTVEVTMN